MAVTDTELGKCYNCSGLFVELFMPNFSVCSLMMDSNIHNHAIDNTIIASSWLEFKLCREADNYDPLEM